MKKGIQVFDYASQIMKALKTGVLLTTKADGKVNTMTISWGALGIEWGKPIFTVYVRENRFTKQQLEKNPEFTINIPVGIFDKKVLGIAGTKSGSTVDKIKELNLTLESPIHIDVPAIKEFPLTLECKVIYKQKQDKDIDSSFHGANRDYHTAFYGEIVNAYIVG